MKFIGIKRTFSTINNEQYKTINAFWDEMIKKYGMENLKGLGYNWTDTTIEYVIGLKNGIIDNANCHLSLPENNWKIEKGDTDKLSSIYKEIYTDGPLKYEIETFFENGKCEIWYYR